MMETDELPVLDSNVDFREVPPLHQKRTIAFVNHFILKTVSFLNTFSSSCESRLMELECKLEKIEASLLILESQLSSIPWLTHDNTDVESKTDDLPLPNVQVQVEVEADTPVPVNNLNNKDSDETVNVIVNVGPTACKDSRFIRYFQMVQFGVPVPAVKLKMKTEGLDPNILDTPNEIIAGCEPHAEGTNSDDDSDSSS